MSATGSITAWLDALKGGDREAAHRLWKRYFHRLLPLARQMLHGTPRRVADEEDVALSAFDSFCRGAERGRFPQLLSRDNLWQLLVVITARKAFDLANYHRRQKRGGEPKKAGLDFAGEIDIEELLDREPSPELAAQFAEECRRMIDLLGNTDLRAVAVWKMEGFSNDEIATRLGCVERTVERKLGVIRSIWSEQLEL